MGKKVLITILAVAALLSCENPIQSGLGNKVDITPPVITMAYPQNIGDHVKGEVELLINAQDDIGVSKVFVAIATAEQAPLLPDNAWIPATLDPKTGQWISALDTTQYPDGDLPVMVKAVDGMGKSVDFAGMYSVKNSPPEI
jgi:hypothetical protein